MATEKWLKEMALGLKSTLPDPQVAAAIEERKKNTRVAIISNLNGNMEGHKVLKKKGYNVKSFGAGVSLILSLTVLLHIVKGKQARSQTDKRKIKAGSGLLRNLPFDIILSSEGTIND